MILLAFAWTVFKILVAFALAGFMLRICFYVLSTLLADIDDLAREGRSFLAIAFSVVRWVVVITVIAVNIVLIGILYGWVTT